MSRREIVVAVDTLAIELNQALDPRAIAAGFAGEITRQLAEGVPNAIQLAARSGHEPAATIEAHPGTEPYQVGVLIARAICEESS